MWLVWLAFIAKSTYILNKNRFAWHSIFLYLVYDVLQCCWTALENSIVIKQRDWERACSAISSLTFAQLAAAAKSVLEKKTHDNPTIQLLKDQIQIIVSQISQSFTCMQDLRSHVQALLVSNELMSFWLTFNSTDLRSLLMLKLAGIDISCNDLSLKARRSWQITVTMNSVTVAQFFNQICNDIFDMLLAADTDWTDIFDQVLNYFDVMKINKRDMLHLHCLIWLTDNLEFCKM